MSCQDSNLESASISRVESKKTFQVSSNDRLDSSALQVVTSEGVNNDANNYTFRNGMLLDSKNIITMQLNSINPCFDLI